MNKKIIGLIVAISVVATLIGTGTWAFFTDTDTTGPNTFTAGVINITVEEESAVIQAAGEIENLKPCMTGYKIITISSTAESNPMEIWKRIIPLTDEEREENGIVDPEQEWYDIPENAGELTDTVDANGDPVEAGKNDLDRYMHFDMWIENGTLPTNPGDVTFDTGDIMIIDEEDGWLVTDGTEAYDWYEPDAISGANGVAGYYMYLGELDIGESITIVQSFHLDPNVENWAQSDSIFITEEFVAQQTEGDTEAPAPGLELPGHGRTDGDPQTWTPEP